MYNIIYMYMSPHIQVPGEVDPATTAAEETGSEGSLSGARASNEKERSHGTGRQSGTKTHRFNQVCQRAPKTGMVVVTEVDKLVDDNVESLFWL